jgi:hypothetical protein
MAMLAFYASPTTASAKKLNNRAEVADLAHEVVQEVQRARIVGLAVDDARVRAAEARAGGRGRRCTRPRRGWPSARRPLTTPRPSRRAGPGRRRTRPRGRRAGVVADRKTEQRLPGHASASACPTRPVPRTVLLAVRRCRVGCVPCPAASPCPAGGTPRRHHPPLLHLVACYKRSSGVLAAGGAGDERVSGPRYRRLRMS